MRLAPLFHDHAVLQRDQSVPIWGEAEPEEMVTVTFAGQVARTFTGSDGRWLLRLAPLPAGGPHELVATAASGTVTARDVLIGEVWICSGQSNMQWKLDQTHATVDDANLPRVRLLTVSAPARLGRQTAIDGRWTVCTPRTLADFSAVGAWFGSVLHRELDVPIGLIANAWGGTRVQAWTSREALMQDPSGRTEISHYEGYVFAPDRIATGECASVADWEILARSRDTGNRGLTDGWAQSDYDDATWQTMPVPSRWQDHGHPGSGVFWFRRRVTVPADWKGRELELHLGSVDKHDDTWVNGERVGGLSWEAGGGSWCTPRVYRVPAALVGADGAITIAVRARSHAFHGGLIGPSTEMLVHPVGDVTGAVALAGVWRYAIEQDWGVLVPPSPPWGPGNPNSPGILFDSRIAPLLPYAIRGAIWYQGESNASEGAVYRRMLPLMIRDWRRAWGQGDFPFLQVQLANFHPPVEQPGRSDWAELRDAQTATLSEPATGMAVAIDVGDALDIHPLNKRSVGERLARIALAETYHRAIVPCGPLLRGATVEAGGRIRCRFNHAIGLRTRDGGPVRHVAIAGADRAFVWAEAAIEGETLVAWHPTILRPAAVRYAWADNPASCNLVNAEDLPASPFRTDGW